MISFQETGHAYTSLPEHQPVDWISVSTLVHALCPPFDRMAISESVSRKPKSKWYGMDPEAIRAAWDKENERSITLGKWYHKLVEDYPENPDNLPVYHCDYKDGTKFASSQRLTDGLYIEPILYLQSSGLCGQSDKVKVIGDIFWVDDHKSNKEIRRQGYYSYNTGTEKMLPPLSHMDHCEYTHYSLQLSLYAYMIMRHNPSLKLGGLTINHVQFEVSHLDEHGYPVYATNVDGSFIVKAVIPLGLPYLKSEVITLLEYLKNNRNKLIKHA